MSNFLVREAQSCDSEAIIDFQIQMALETENLKLVKKSVSMGVLAVFNDPSKGKYYVAEKNGIVISSLLITFEWSDWRNCNVWWIQSVYVKPDFRRTGVFIALYSYIKSLVLVNENLTGIRLYVDKSNIAAQHVYEAIGMNGEHYRLFEWMKPSCTNVHKKR